MIGMLFSSKHDFKRAVNGCTPSGDGPCIFHSFNKVKLIRSRCFTGVLDLDVEGFAVGTMPPNVTLTGNADLDESAVFGIEVTDGMVDGVAAFCAQSGDDAALKGCFLFLYSGSPPVSFMKHPQKVFIFFPLW